MVKAERNSDSRPTIVSSVMEATKNRSVWPVSLSSLTQLGTKSVAAFGDRWWVVDDVAEVLDKEGLFQFSPIHNKTPTTPFNYANGVTRESLEAFLHIFSEVLAGLPTEFEGPWTEEKWQNIQSQIEYLPLTELASKAKQAMGDAPGAESILVESPSEPGNVAGADSVVNELRGMAEDPETEESNLAESAAAGSGTVVFAPAEVVSGDEAPDRFPGLINPELRKLFEAHRDLFLPESGDLIPTQKVIDNFQTLFPGASQKMIRSFFTYLLYIKKQFIPEKMGGQRSGLSSETEEAIATLFHFRLQAPKNGNKKLRFDSFEKDAKAAWREGSDVYALLDSSLKLPNGLGNTSTLQEVSQEALPVNGNGDAGTRDLEAVKQSENDDVPAGTSFPELGFDASRQEAAQVSRHGTVSQTGHARTVVFRGSPQASTSLDQSPPTAFSSREPIGGSVNTATDADLSRIRNSVLLQKLRDPSLDVASAYAQKAEEISPSEQKVKDLRFSPLEKQSLQAMQADHAKRKEKDEGGDPNIPGILLPRLMFWDLGEVEKLIGVCKRRVKEGKNLYIDNTRDIDYASLISMQYIVTLALQKDLGEKRQFPLDLRKDVLVSSFLPYAKYIRNMLVWKQEHTSKAKEDITLLVLYQTLRQGKPEELEAR